MELADSICKESTDTHKMGMKKNCESTKPGTHKTGKKYSFSFLYASSDGLAQYSLDYT